MTNRILKLATLTLLLGNTAIMNAQVTIGSDKDPEVFSLLELVSGNNKGLRLPQIETTAKRDAMANVAFKTNPLSVGLQIFNMETKCVETWNGTTWICLCDNLAPSSNPAPANFGDGYLSETANLDVNQTIYHDAQEEDGIDRSLTATAEEQTCSENLIADIQR